MYQFLNSLRHCVKFNIGMFGVISCLLLALFSVGHCDYTCLCNYNTEKTVFTSPSVQGGILGYMYEFDCKPQAEKMGEWITVAYEHKLGYVEKDANLQIQTCPGLIPDEDKLPSTTIAAASTTTSTIVSTTIAPSTRTTEPVTSPTTTSTPTMSTVSSTAAPKTTAPSVTVMTTTPVPTTSSTMSMVPSTSTSTPAPKSTTVSTTTTMPTVPTTTTMSTVQTTTTMSTIPSTKRTTAAPTSTSTSSTTTQTVPSTTMTPRTTSDQTTTASILQGHLESCPNRIQHLAKQSGELLAQFGQKCYEVVQSGVSWSHAESNCKRNGGHLVHIANQQEQEFIYHFLVKHHSHTVWLGLHDRSHEENFEWTSGDPVTYTNWKPGRKDSRNHNSEDCVYMSPSSGQWDDIQCGGDNALSELLQGHRHAYVCEYATVNPMDGDLTKCSSSLHQQAETDRGILGQFEQSCYEAVPNAVVDWKRAEDGCHSRGGHLANILNAQEQNFIQNFLQRYSPNHAVWIGLTDLNSEGTFHWTSGASVQYTNWVPGHTSNYVSHDQEDCTVFIPYKNGQWDDIPCGRTTHSLFGGTSSSGETHPLLCQYKISSQPAIVG